MKAEKALPASLDNSRLPQIALVALVVLLGVAFFLLTETVPNISDTIGYVYAGERLANGDGPTFEDPNNQVAGAYFSLYAFQIERPDDPRFFLGFPPGFPLLLALGQRLGGPGAIHYVVPLLAVAGLAVTYGLARLLGGNAWTAVWSALVLALTPAYWEFGTAAWSEMPAMVVMVGGICFYLLSRQPGRTDRQVHVFSLLAAVLIGYSFFIRYANVSVLPALVLYELAAGPSSILRERRRRSFYGLIALALGAMLLFNQVYYGGWQQTSYSPAHGWYPQSPFSLAYAFGPSFVNGYSLLESFRSLVHNFSFLLLLVPIGWMLLPRRSGLLAAAATLATLGLYAVYAFAPTGINSRFLLPAYPFLALAIGVTVSELGQRLPGRRWRAPAALLLLAVLFWPVPAQVEALQARNVQGPGTANHVRYLTADSEADAVFMSYVYNDHIVYYAGRSVLNYRRIPVSDPQLGRYRLEMLEPCLVATVDRLLAQQTPIYYIEDSSPPFWNSLAILEANYHLKQVRSEPNIYRLQESLQSASSSGEQRCQP